MSEQTPEQYDPSAYTVDEVQKHLDTVDADEFARIVKAEQDGKARQGIVTYTQDPEKAAPGDDGYARVIVDGYPAPSEG